MATAVSPNEALMELGKLYYERCDFTVAIDKFKQAAAGFYEERELKRYLKCQNYLLRMYAEREDQESIRVTKERLQDLVLKEGFELNAQTYYTLGISACYKGQYEISLDYFQKSLALALASDDKSDICHAINGLAITYAFMERYQEALKEIYNLQVFFQVMNIQEIKLASQMLNGRILRKMKQYEQALELYWECYEQLRVEKNMFLYSLLLYSIGATHKDAGNADLARTYLTLAKRTIDPENLKHLSKYVEKDLQDLGVTSTDSYDLVFDSVTNSLTERKRGKVDFKNQFILLDMLRLFMKEPGMVYSKEMLVKQVWKQDYDPSVHDNKIYVTIKRLRKLIEPDYDKPRYIFRAKNGYFMNKNTKILLENV